jgi:hypothetical protein
LILWERAGPALRMINNISGTNWVADGAVIWHVLETAQGLFSCY